MRTPTEPKKRVLATIKKIGKYNRISNRYEFMIYELSQHSDMRGYSHDRLMSFVDSLIRSYVIKLIGYNKYSCDAKALENLDADLD